MMKIKPVEDTLNTKINALTDERNKLTVRLSKIDSKLADLKELQETLENIELKANRI